MPVATVKPGFKSSEFWLSLLGTLAGVAGFIPGPWGAVAAVILPGVYAAGRSYVQGQALKANAPAPAPNIATGGSVIETAP